MDGWIKERMDKCAAAAAAAVSSHQHHSTPTTNTLRMTIQQNVCQSRGNARAKACQG